MDELQLKQSCYFRDLKDDQLKKIAGIGNIKAYKSGEVLVKESDTDSNVFFILTGRVDVSVSLVGTNHTESIATITEKEMVGEMVLLGNVRRSATVTAKDDITVIEWNSRDLINLFASDNAIGFYFMRNMAKEVADRLSSANQVLRNALTLPSSTLF